MTFRRDVLFGGLLTFTFGIGASCACHAQALGQGPSRSKRTPHTFGCVLAESDVDRVQPLSDAATQGSTNSAAGGSRTGQATLITSSKDREFDRALANTLARISDLLQVLPGFAYFDDHDGMNAYATNRVRMQRPDGTVLRVLDDQLQCDVPPVGLDFSRAMLDLARADDPNAQRGARYVEASAVALPFRDASFDRVICAEVMEHVHDYRAAARELALAARCDRPLQRDARRYPLLRGRHRTPPCGHRRARQGPRAV